MGVVVAAVWTRVELVVTIAVLVTMNPAVVVEGAGVSEPPEYTDDINEVGDALPRRLEI